MLLTDPQFQKALQPQKTLLSVHRCTSILTGKFFAQTFRAPTGSCFSFAARIAMAQRACEVFSIE